MKPISQWYPPSKYVFKPIYNFFRRKSNLNQYVSFMLTLDVSAGLHALPFLVRKRYTEAMIFGGFFVGVGIAGATSKYLEKRDIKKNRIKTIDSLIE